MARKRTKKQKKQTDQKLKSRNVSVALNESGMPEVVADSKKSVRKPVHKAQNKSTKMNKSQVSLIYKDLLKTAVVSLIVFILLLFIFVYMR